MSQAEDATLHSLHHSTESPRFPEISSAPAAIASRLDVPEIPEDSASTQARRIESRGSDRIVRLEGELQQVAAQVSKISANGTSAQSRKTRDYSFLISLLALLFSFGTTAVSWYRTNQTDIADARRELRTLIQRLVALPRENQDLLAKYADRPDVSNNLSGAINQENVLLARQAAELVRRIPTYVSATEYLAVFLALDSSGLTADGIEFLDAAVVQATNATDAVAALRNKARLLFNQGDVNAGRLQYQAALAVYDRFPGPPPQYQWATHALTELYWAQMELTHSECADALHHIHRAQKLVATAPVPTSGDPIRVQIDDFANHATAICKN